MIHAVLSERKPVMLWSVATLAMALMAVWSGYRFSQARDELLFQQHAYDDLTESAARIEQFRKDTSSTGSTLATSQPVDLGSVLEQQVIRLALPATCVARVTPEATVNLPDQRQQIFNYQVDLRGMTLEKALSFLDQIEHSEAKLGVQELRLIAATPAESIDQWNLDLRLSQVVENKKSISTVQKVMR